MLYNFTHPLRTKRSEKAFCFSTDSSCSAASLGSLLTSAPCPGAPGTVPGQDVQWVGQGASLLNTECNYLVIMQWEWKRSRTVTGVKNRCCSVRATCFLITDNPIQPCPLCQLIWALQWEWSNNKCPALDNPFSSFQRKDLSHFHKQSYFPVIGLTWWTGPNNFTVNLDLISSSTLLSLSQVLSSAVVNWESIIPARTQVSLVPTLWFRSSACHLSPIKQWKVYKCIYS